MKYNFTLLTTLLLAPLAVLTAAEKKTDKPNQRGQELILDILVFQSIKQV